MKGRLGAGFVRRAVLVRVDPSGDLPEGLLELGHRQRRASAERDETEGGQVAGRLNHCREVLQRR